jgi:hypothetical protein
MLIKFRLSERKEWDREIIKWLKEVPRGYRPAFIKQKLYEALNNENVPNSIPRSDQSSASEQKYDLDVDKKIEKLLNF